MWVHPLDVYQKNLERKVVGIGGLLRCTHPMSQGAKLPETQI